VAGYTTYIDLIRPLIEGKTVISTAMMKEVQRVRAAIEAARGGACCALVCSGDAGIYAMAGLAFEMLKEMRVTPLPPAAERTEALDTLTVEIIPGIPALASGASLLGAPLTHDFAVISLSDLLTPWETIEKRIEAAATADFVIVIYNPKSKRRKDNLQKAQEIILRHRDPQTPVGIVTGAMRTNQAVSIVDLADLHEAPVDMQTTVFVGSSASFRYRDYMVTPRGYSGKYDL
jgi:precorrin-3B C17-methyltransferase